ncbi:hypothetical protein [Streptomyces sp. NRRL WC-3742]|uniref:hypothetical protein n=1 Tax=Streptomyces sp. NRRL WC-3742 TaxID=1463934 RepID=UPI0004C65B24|nr:hypothetical protein [Streptomyces sp. NRRL WC-3742]
MTGNDAQDRDIWLGLGLAEAASEAKVGPVPMADIMAGGRRIRRRRRTVVGALALASAVALGGGALTQLHPAPVATAAGGPGTAAALGPAAAPATATTPAAKDPLKPQRVLLAEGTTDGKSWKVWRALWPLAPKERAYEQALAVWQERSAYTPDVSKPTEAFVQQYWQPGNDVTNDYVEVDGVRQGHDGQGVTPAAGHLLPEMAAQSTFGGGMLGHWSKDDPGPFFPAEIGMVDLGPTVDKVVVTWSDGTKTEPKPVTVGDSPIRVIAMGRPQDKRATLWQFFDRDGKKVPNDGTTLFR